MVIKKFPEALYDICVIEPCTEIGTNIIKIEYDNNSTENSSEQDSFGYHMVCDRHYDEVMRNYYKKAKTVMEKVNNEPREKPPDSSIVKSLSVY